MNKKQRSENFLAWWRYQFDQIQKWDWRAIIFCGVLAAVFWLFNSLNREHTTDLNYPIEVKYSGNNVFVIKRPPKYIKINVSGIGWNLLKRSLNMDMQPCIIQFENLAALTNTNFYLTRSLLPEITTNIKELQVHYLLEDSIFFDFDTLYQKEVLLKLDTVKLPLAKGIRLATDVRVVPDRVTISGPSATVLAFGDTLLLSLDAADIESDFLSELPIDIPEQTNITVQPDHARVELYVSKFDERSISVGLELVNFPPDSSITIQPGRASVSYLIEHDEQYIPQDTLKVVIDYRRMSRRDSTVRPVLIAPKYFIDPKVNPSRFKIKIE